MRPFCARRALSLIATVVAIAAFTSPRSASAQAWAGNEGEASVTFGTAFQFSDTVYWGGDIGAISGLDAQALRTHIGGEYTPIDKLTVGAEIAGQLNRYTGAQTASRPDIVVAHGTQDDGTWHSNITDLHLNARYQIHDGDFALSPIVEVKLPVTDYENLGYAAAGTGLLEVGAGAYIGKFGLFTDRLFAQAGYTFTFVETADIDDEQVQYFSMNHSDASLTFGYLFTPKFWAAAGTSVRVTHGGFDLADYPNASAALRTYHDPILSRRFWGANLAANYLLTDSLSITGVFGAVLIGTNVSNAKTLGINLTWTRLPEP